VFDRHNDVANRLRSPLTKAIELSRPLRVVIDDHDRIGHGFSSIRRSQVRSPSYPPELGKPASRSADEAAAELAHDRVLLHSRRSHGDLTAHRPVTACGHGRQEAPQRRQVRKVANGAAKGGTARLVLTPYVVHGLARDRDPAARFAGDLDHASRVRVGSAGQAAAGRGSRTALSVWFLPFGLEIGRCG
jgi:hypothetical protein